MNEHVERVATAALFHDIGKFWSRTGASRPYTQQEAESKRYDHPALETPVCQLACGDLSGIQDFLYSIVSKHAAKTLRGRSFALQLLCEGIAHHLLDRAGVPASCLLFSGGGRFYLLLPRDVDVQALAADAARAVHDGLRGDLAVHVAAVPLRAGDFFEGRMAEKWGEVGLALGATKRRRYTALAEDDYDSVFGVMDEGGFKGRCEVCGCECDADAETLCPDCDEYARLGHELGQAQALLRTEADPAHARGVNRALAPLGFAYHLAGDGPKPPGRVLEAQMLGAYTPARFLDGRNLHPGVSVTRRWAARAWPRNGDGGVRTFEELAEASTGIHKLGVLRADVDNLGRLFATGLGNRATLSRVASLSSSLGDFFEGYLPEVALGDYPHTVGVLYAGGDDLFVVGAWSEVIDFAVQIREDFSRFCCDNPAFTLSGGVAVIDDHLPLRHAARLAGDAEEAAKHYTRDGREKDALTLFESPIGFEEFGRFREFHELLVDLLGEGGLPQSFLRRLFDIWETYQAERDHLARQQQPGQLNATQLKRLAQWQRWRWMLTYGLREFSKKHKEQAERIEDVQRRLLDDGPHSIEDRLGVPLRWTELKLRKEG
jgi:CRISPR-associated protein Csm1